MDDTQLDRALRSIGKECFVEYFWEFAKPRISRADMIDLLMREKGYAEVASGTRVSGARRIIGAGRAKDALIEIGSSDRLPQAVTDRAREISCKL